MSRIPRGGRHGGWFSRCLVMPQESFSAPFLSHINYCDVPEVVLMGEDGPLHASIQLTPFHDTRIQRIAVMDDEELEGSPLCSFRRFSVVVPQSAL